MPYEIKEKDGKFFVVDKETQRIRGTYDDEDAADDRKDDLEFKEYMRRSVSPKEMTTEEKAAAWDKHQAEKEKEPPVDDKNIPPKKDPKEDPPKPKRSLYWGDMVNDND